MLQCVSRYNYIISFSRLEMMTKCMSGCLIRLLGEFVTCECMTVIFAPHIEHFQNQHTEAARGRYSELQEYLSSCFHIKLSVLCAGLSLISFLSLNTRSELCFFFLFLFIYDLV